MQKASPEIVADDAAIIRRQAIKAAATGGRTRRRVKPMSRPSAPERRTCVFISYARRDRQAARRLATYLKSRGISVWWDTHLVGGENFRSAIEEHLASARVVVVIWSQTSVRSDFVIDEADRGRKAGKLVPVSTRGFDRTLIPNGFRQLHTVVTSDREAILRALQVHGIKAKAAVAV